MNQQVIAGIDIGGTKVALALADSAGVVLAHTRYPTQTETGPHRVVDKAVAELQQMVEATGGTLGGVGVGCAGPLDCRRGLILSPPNLPGWDEFPLTERLRERLGVAVVLDNDANAAALGEHLYGAGRGFRDLIYITISTGIGGGIIVGDELVHGVRDSAGEVGHMTVWPDGPACPCGARGCLEAICSGTSIARRAQERLSGGSGARSSLTEMAGGEVGGVTAQHVVAAALGGDALASVVWDETIYYLAVGVGNLISVLAPEAVILGGGVSTAGEPLLEPLRRQVRARVRMVPFDRVTIVQAALKSESGIYGALILGHKAAASAFL